MSRGLLASAPRFFAGRGVDTPTINGLPPVGPVKPLFGPRP